MIIVLNDHRQIDILKEYSPKHYSHFFFKKKSRGPITEPCGTPAPLLSTGIFKYTKIHICTFKSVIMVTLIFKNDLSR